MAITTIKGSGKIPTIYRNTALTNSAVQVSSVPILLKGINVINTNLGSTSHAFLKFYNATSAVVGTTAIVKTFLCEQNAATFISADEFGLEYFDTAMCVAITGAVSDADTSTMAIAPYCEISYTLA
jgi:hypothetical protein